MPSTPDPVVNHLAERQVPNSRPSLGLQESVAVSAAVMEGQVSAGPRVAAFETEIARAHGKTTGVACSSGTAALHLALEALDIGKGSIVAIPSLAFVSVANAVLHAGAKPIFVDSEYETGNLDPEMLARLFGVTDAFIVPHLYGMPATMPEPFPAATPIIEDCAEAHYSPAVARRGRIATFSFFGNKIVTTGEGGMAITDEPFLAERMRALRAHNMAPRQRFAHVGLGWNYKMGEMQAALGLVQHQRRAELLQKRAAVAEIYLDGLQRILGIAHPIRPEGSVWWTFPVLFNDEKAKRAAWERLAMHGIDARPYFTPLHLQPHLKKFARGERFPVAEDLAKRGLCLPLYPDMSGEEAAYVLGHLSPALA